MNRMNFRHDYNGKLGNNYFITIRVKNPKYSKGEEYELFDEEKGYLRGYGRIVRIREMTHLDINDWLAYVDSGLSAEELRQELSTLYGEEYKLHKLFLVLVHRITRQAIQQSLF